MKIDPTDIFAVILMIVLSMRRVEIRSTEASSCPHLPRAQFEAWKRRALFARNVSIQGCFAKFALNSIWFYGFRARVAPLTLVRGGLLIFGGWLIAVIVGWLLFSRAMDEARRLRIVIGRRPDGAEA